MQSKDNKVYIITLEKLCIPEEIQISEMSSDPEEIKASNILQDRKKTHVNLGQPDSLKRSYP